eukprot:206612_1
MSTQDMIKLLEIAKYAPSGGNLQPWKIYLIDSDGKKEGKWSLRLVITIDKQMEIGQYVDLGAIIQNIKLLSPQFGLDCAATATTISFLHLVTNETSRKQIRDLVEIPDHEKIFCELQIRRRRTEGAKRETKRNIKSANDFIFIPNLSKI